MAQVVTPGNLGPDFSLGGEVPSKITVVPASATAPGKTRYATAAEAAAGVVGNAALTPAVLLGAINALLPAFTGDVTKPAGSTVLTLAPATINATHLTATVLLEDTFGVDIGYAVPL